MTYTKDGLINLMVYDLRMDLDRIEYQLQRDNKSFDESRLELKRCLEQLRSVVKKIDTPLGGLPEIPETEKDKSDG